MSAYHQISLVKKSTFLLEYGFGFQQADVFSEWLPELIYYVVTHCVHPSKIWHCKKVRKAGWKKKNVLSKSKIASNLSGNLYIRRRPQNSKKNTQFGFDRLEFPLQF